jgi:hypothetical protein
MRDTFIGVFGGIVLVVSVMAFALMRLSLGDVSQSGQARTAVNAAAAQLEVETMRVERWLATQAADEAANDSFDAASPEARGDLATKYANLVVEHAKSAGTDLAEITPTGVYLFDDKGVVVGRDHSKLSRGDQLGEIYAEMLKTIIAGKTGSALWISKALNHQMLASYAPIRDTKGKVVGGIAFGRALLERLNAASQLSGGTPLYAVVPAGDDMAIFARTPNATPEMEAGVPSMKQALGTDQPVTLGGLPANFEGAARGLSSYGNGKQAVVAAIVKTKAIAPIGSMVPPLAIAIFIGLLLVVAGAHLVNQYITQPVGDLEEGLLAILNGQTDIRFELEHKVLGGLVFRLNSLLNQLLGVQEDNTDEEGRSSHAPGAPHAAFTASLHLDERLAEVAVEDAEGALALREVSPEDYYKQVYDAYLAGQRKTGSPVDVKFAPFSARIKQIELQLTNKHGRPFRLNVEVDGNDVVFVAVPME